MIYLDTSLLAALYTLEVRTHGVVELLEDEAVSISDLTEVELFSSIAKKTRQGLLSITAGRAACRQFDKDVDAGRFERVGLRGTDFIAAGSYLRAFATPLRALDAMHVAICASNGLHLHTADRILHESAETFGVASVLIV